MLSAELALRLNNAAPRYIDPTVVLGDDVHIWHFAVVLAHVRLGDSVSIGSHTEIGHHSIIGNRTRISQGCFLPAHSLVGDDVFIGPGTIFTDDRYPIAGNREYNAQPPRIADFVSIGAGCVILPGVHIGSHSVIGAGSVVTSDVAPSTIVYGEAARVKRASSTFPNLSRESLGKSVISEGALQVTNSQ